MTRTVRSQSLCSTKRRELLARVGARPHERVAAVPDAAPIAFSGSKRAAGESPYARPVAGMNCAKPPAPAGERANGLKFDSA